MIYQVSWKNVCFSQRQNMCLLPKGAPPRFISTQNLNQTFITQWKERDGPANWLHDSLISVTWFLAVGTSKVMLCSEVIGNLWSIKARSRECCCGDLSETRSFRKNTSSCDKAELKVLLVSIGTTYRICFRDKTYRTHITADIGEGTWVDWGSLLI